MKPWSRSMSKGRRCRVCGKRKHNGRVGKDQRKSKGKK